MQEAQMDPWSLFLYGMKAPMTREKYRGRLAKFFDFIGLTKGTMEGRAQVGSMLALAGTNKLADIALSVQQYLQLKHCSS